MAETSQPLIDDICSADPATVVAALQAAAPHRETLTPVLLARLGDASTAPERWIEDDHGKSPIFLCYLAAAWRLAVAHPLLAAMLRLPAQQCDDLLGDFTTEGARLVLADTWPGNLHAIEGVVFDAAAYPFARGAALAAVALLIARDRLPREDGLALLARAAAQPFDPDNENDVIAATGVVSTVMDLQAWELRGSVTALYEHEVVDPTFCGSLDDVLAELKTGAIFHGDGYRFPSPIDDAWEHVRRWHFFSPLFPERTSRHVRPSPKPASKVASPELELTPPPSDDFLPPQPYVAPPKVGRNDPCPCGSGKKYKKCCGA